MSRTARHRSRNRRWGLVAVERVDDELADLLLRYDGTTVEVDLESATMATDADEVEVLDVLDRRAA